MTGAQWIIWRAELRADGRTDKLPLDPNTLNLADAHDPRIWLTREAADARAAELGPPFGVGFVFTDRDPYFFIDIDDCLSPDGTAWDPLVAELLGLLPGAAVEVSQSGRGIHIVGSGTVTAERKIKAGKLFDLYTSGRFMALGQGFASGSVDTDCTAGLAAIVERWLSPDAPVAGAPDEWTTGPSEEWSGPTDDAELLKRASRAQSAAAVFGGGVTFTDLWDGNGAALGAKWPDPHGAREYDASSADAALAQHLAFWTGNDCDRIRRLMMLSELVRDKWTDRPDYLNTTILNAVKRQEAVYQRRSGAPAPGAPAVEGERPGFQYLSVSEQVAHFAGCVYISELHRAITPSGRLLRPDQFRASYGGHVFALDAQNDKTTKNAWEAFTESQGYKFPKVDALRFNPRGEPGEIGTDPHGWSFFNSFVPQWGARSAEPATPFLEHIAKLLPSERDREILLSYLAALVQRPGVKFQWCVLLQGAQGNGKTLIWRVLEHALGQRYCHQIQPKDLESSFNAWLEGKLLMGVEEIRVGSRRDLADSIKPLITNHRVSIQPKGIDQYTGDNYANFLLFSNHQDAVLKSVNDRRYCVLYTAQQELGDLARDGMTEDYFDALFEWLDERGGLEAVAGYLASRPVSIRPMGRAPRTTATDEAIRNSLGPAEQLIIEALDADEPGFQGGIVDPAIVRRHLDANGRRLAPRSVAAALRRVGFVPHPCLEEQHGKVLIDGSRRRLWVEVGSDAAAITDPLELVEIWRNTQINL